MKITHVLSALAIWAAATVHADAQEKADTASDPSPAPSYRVYPDEPASMEGTVTIDGDTVHFRADAGLIAISSDERTASAKLFYISYTRLDAPGGAPLDPGRRPITFSFNGGPGSSSVWLHLGLFGPYRVAYADEMGAPSAPPHGLVDNEASLLDISDFVFIDPVSTGFSRAEEDVDPKGYHGLEGDIEAVGSFIVQYLSRNKRWASPRFIAGESYGTTRAAGLTEHLWNRHGVSLNGVMLISTILNFQTLRFGTGNDLPHALFLPNFAATAHYHGQLGDDLQAMDVADLVDEVRDFATGDYTTFLMRNADADAELRRTVLERLARYTGLDPAYIEDTNLRPAMPGFCKELLREQGVTVGRLDSRFTGVDRMDAGDAYEYDPSYSAILGSYTSGLNQLVRERIGFETDLPYEILTGRVRPWDPGRAGDGRYIDVAERLRGAMQQQPALRVYNAAGYYDLATTSAAADYTLSRTFADPGLRDRITRKYYESGHMMYVHGPSRRAQRDDLVAFYRGAMSR